MKNEFIFEVCIESLESAQAAENGGANRLELCGNLGEGGTTPSMGMLAACLETSSLEVMVMIRPRGGDFVYGDGEYEVMKRDIEYAKSLGAKGVVLGLLTQQGEIDVERTQELITLARPLEVTFHRAFDWVQDPFKALDQLIEMGVERILTSGQAPTAETGIPLLQQLVTHAKGRISIMAGAGVHEGNAQKIVQQTGIHEIHGSASITIPSAFQPTVQMGERDTMSRKVTSQEKVQMIVKAIGN